MGKASKRSSTPGQAAEPASEEIPFEEVFSGLSFMEINKQGQLVIRTERWPPQPPETISTPDALKDRRNVRTSDDTQGRGIAARRRSRPVLDVYVPVAKDLWPPHGTPSREEISNSAALSLLNKELRRFGKAKRERDPTSLLRAIGRRR
jgi:hypothetical protein